MTTYYTKKQLESVLGLWYQDREWKDIPKVPRTGDQLIVKFPNQTIGTCTITVHDVKSTYKETLYQLVFSS